jgi:hypothetical protein
VLHHLRLHLGELALLSSPFLLKTALDFFEAVNLLVEFLELVLLAPIVRLELGDPLLRGILGILNLLHSKVREMLFAYSVLDLDELVSVHDVLVIIHFVLLLSLRFKAVQFLAQTFPLLLRFKVRFLKVV